MTNQERAEKIVSELNLEDRFNRDDFKDVVELITSQLDEAQHDILEQSEPVVKLRISEAVREAIAWTQKDSYQRGFASAVDKAAAILLSTKYDAPIDQLSSDERAWNGQMEELARRILAMEAEK